MGCEQRKKRRTKKKEEGEICGYIRDFGFRFAFRFLDARSFISLPHFPDHDSGKNYVNEGVRVEFVKRRIFDTMGYERGYVCTMRNAVISLTSRNRFVVACMVCPFFLSMMKMW